MTISVKRLTAALADRYRIERELGQGGMATVYLAQDLKHDRKVALKVLKPELAAVLGAERFVVEIKTTASLQHPHILPLFDSGTADGFLYYVMPFIQGETLRDKLNRETQLGVNEAVKIATDVADALHYAHTQGVIHRDIKPENILLANGRPMVADFGIALAVSAAAGGRMTETGLSLGTPHYMSPEQATAEKEISARSDVYSLASVLYEMLTGQPPHSGGSAQQIIMKIITEAPPLVTTLRKSVPPNVAAAAAKALEKLPADRFESAKCFGDALTNPAFRIEGQTAGTGVAFSAAVSRRAFTGVTALAVLAGTAALWGWLRPTPTPAPTPARFQLSLFTSSSGDGWQNMALSPDGQAIAWSASGAERHADVRARGKEQSIWLKTAEQAVAEPLAGTEGGSSPAFSPNGDWIAFVADGRLRKIRRDGRDLTTIAEGVAQGTSSTAWLDDGTVLFTGPRFDLSAVGADGRTRVIIPRDSLPNNIFDIAAVPGSRSALVITCASNCAQAVLWAVDLASGARKQLAERAMRVWHLNGGLTVFAERVAPQRILAAPYDEKSMSFTAAPIPVLEDVRRSGGEGISMALSANGTLLYAPAFASNEVQPIWVTRDGRSSPVDSTWSFDPGTGGPVVSPDGRRLAVTIQDGASTTLWLKDLTAGGGLTRLTFDGIASTPQWTGDGGSLVYTHIYAGTRQWDVKRRRVDGADSGRTVFRSRRDLASFALLRDTGNLVVRFGPQPTRDIYVTRRGSTAGDTLVPLMANDGFEEVAMSLSPDERWLAYTSDESRRFEVYVVPFPDVKSGRWQISAAGGRSPRWARSGRELFFKDLADGLLAVPVTSGPSPFSGERRLLFRLPALNNDPMQVSFDTSPDDSRFLFLRALGREDAQASNVVLVQNWLTEVKERMKGAR